MCCLSATDYINLVDRIQSYGTIVIELKVIKIWKLPIICFNFQRRLLGISWKDKVRNEEVRQWTNLKEMNLVIKERRWLGHVLRVEDNRIPKPARYWRMDLHVKRKPGRSRKNWIDTICQDLKTIGMAWEEAEESAAEEKIGVEVWPNVSTTRVT